MRSSRYRVMSRVPVGTSWPAMAPMACARRRAIGTPRVRIPTSASSSVPRFLSTISCAILVRVRAIRSASITTGMEKPLDRVTGQSGHRAICRDEGGACGRASASDHLFTTSPGRVKETPEIIPNYPIARLPVGYTAAMPTDVVARVMANRRLSPDYNVLSLAAPAVAAAASPGQFVVIRAGRGHDPLLRRPFSVFEVLRSADGTPTGISLLNKRIGVSTMLLYA